MKRSRIRPVSDRQLQAQRKLPKFGRCACTWCGTVTWCVPDHVVERSLLPGENRDHRDNIVPACERCNGRRNDGWKPDLRRAPSRTIRFVLGQIGAYRAARYFEHVEDATA